MENPDMVFGIDCHTYSRTDDPVIRQWLRPERVYLEHRYLYTRRLNRGLLVHQHGPTTQNQNDHQKRPAYGKTSLYGCHLCFPAVSYHRSWFTSKWPLSSSPRGRPSKSSAHAATKHQVTVDRSIISTPFLVYTRHCGSQHSQRRDGAVIRQSGG